MAAPFKGFKVPDFRVSINQDLAENLLLIIAQSPLVF